MEEYGADVTADNAPNALREAMKMLETLRKEGHPRGSGVRRSGVHA
ncbi:MAG: hypothetical protein U0411_10315 [Thermodesulfovibrionales bacterium]